MFTVVLASCREHDEPDPIADKTIILYFPYTGTNGNLYSFFLTNINDVKTSIKNDRGMGNNNVVAFVSRNQNIAHLMKFRYENGAVLQDTLRTYADPILTSEDGISQILNDVKTYAPANKYGMVIGAHGQGWIPATGTHPYKSRYFGSGSIGYQTNVSTLGDALKMSQMHLQFLLFDCCYMACMENVYELRDVTDYYIASTSEIMNVGMPYSLIFHSLMVNEPLYDEVSRLFNEFYSNYEMPYGTIAVANCSYAAEVAAKMREINQRFDFDTSKTNLVQDLDGAYHNPTIYFDFGSYVDNLCTDEALLQEFHQALDKLVPYKSATRQIMSDSPRSYIDVNSFSGLTISDPSTNTKTDEKTLTPWWVATH